MMKESEPEDNHIDQQDTAKQDDDENQIFDQVTKYSDLEMQAEATTQEETGVPYI